MLHPLRAALAALIVGPALALGSTLVAAAGPPAHPPMAAAEAQQVAAQAQIDMAALHEARVKAGELSSAQVGGDEPGKGTAQKAPYDNFYAPYECNPHRNAAIDWGGFCFHDDGFRSRTMWAWSWAQQHPKKADRNPVPFPGLGDGGGGKLAMLPHTTYVVTFSGVKKSFIGPVRKDAVFKYGITSIPHYQTRANKGRSECKKYVKKHKLRDDCARTWVAVVPATYGWDNARFMEASLIKDYERYYGKCPPGQRTSCR